MDFKLESDFLPTGDQPEAIKNLVAGLKSNEKFQTLMGGEKHLSQLNYKRI